MLCSEIAGAASPKGYPLLFHVPAEPQSAPACPLVTPNKRPHLTVSGRKVMA
jgi:hypothetical protein